MKWARADICYPIKPIQKYSDKRLHLITLISTNIWFDSKSIDKSINCCSLFQIHIDKKVRKTELPCQISELLPFLTDEGEEKRFTRRADAADMYGVIQFSHSIQYDALSLHHCTLQQTELLILQLLGQLTFSTGLDKHNHIRRYTTWFIEVWTCIIVKNQNQWFEFCLLIHILHIKWNKVNSGDWLVDFRSAQTNLKFRLAPQKTTRHFVRIWSNQNLDLKKCL